jgi:uncharacterized protein YigE (DUF2233 family)
VSEAKAAVCCVFPLLCVLLLAAVSPALAGDDVGHAAARVSPFTLRKSPFANASSAKGASVNAPARQERSNTATSAQASPVAAPPPTALPVLAWTTLEKGLELGLAQLPESVVKGNGACFVVIRIAPDHHEFTLRMASEEGQSRSLPDWSLRGDLRAGINASMYLPDNRTSTGYMRRRDSVNNSSIGGRLGAFFVAGPRKPGLAEAAIVERDEPGWRDTLNAYDIVVQNYRLVNKGGVILWPDGGPEHSAAAVAVDGQGKVLFILSQEALTPMRFASYIKAFPIDVRSVMYVEGGAQAGCFVRTDDSRAKGGTSDAAFAGAVPVPVPGGVIHVWKGRQNVLNLRGSPQAVVPNIIGIVR